MSSVTLCLRSLSTISSKEVIPTLLDFECYKTGFIDEHCGVLTAVFCDLTIFKMKMSTSTLISFSSLFFCSDVTYFAEPQAFSKRKALDNIDLNLVSHRYVSGVLKDDHFVPLARAPLASDRSLRGLFQP